MRVETILESMRDGAAQTPESIAAFVHGVVDGSFSRPQASAWLAWAYVRGLSDDETVWLTRAMTESGEVLVWPDGPPCVDKHSTGGVGDKVSLVLAPLWASLGYRVPMVSGRGLGHTGGTLDKLESIPGFRADLSRQELERALDSVGCFISGQTAQLAPADRVLYALRNETSTVPSIPLIVASILSKKLASGVGRLVLDVKVGTGAFMTDLPRARALAEALVRVAVGAGLDSRALITRMDQPLGAAVGNALEVREAIACLRGEGPSDLRELVLTLADHPDAARALDDGTALARFEAMIAAQGGDPRVIDDPSRLAGGGATVASVVAPRDGFVTRVDALAIGRAAFLLGAGRSRAEDPVDPGVGVEVLVAPGDAVVRGQPIARLHHRAGRALNEAEALVASGLTLGDAASPLAPLVHAVVVSS